MKGHHPETQTMQTVHRVEPPHQPGRTDVVLARQTGLSRTVIQRLLAKHAVIKEGDPQMRLKPKDPMDVSATYIVSVPEPEPLALVSEPMALDILFEDEHIVVIHKPAGLVVHPAPGHHTGTLVHGLLAHCQDLSGIGGVKRPGIVHRLDKDTSGLLLVAKHDQAHAALSKQFRKRTLGRLYQALVWGVPKPLSGWIDAPLGRHPRNRQKQAVTSQGRPAKTFYKVWTLLQDNIAHLVCRLETGRTHQIRVHLAHMGVPVLGDTLYGRTSLPAARQQVTQTYWPHSYQALHASYLYFHHPHTQEPMHFCAPLPSTWPGALRQISEQDYQDFLRAP
ncbi:RluA family pseudouridine synthase [Candidatus Hepatobacter penaei]|uniref:RluA family pseudouridine synthase n=1 Tax=Candidatus Hepatobacter penaei TaxID=1274402 RepID=UPI000B2EB1A3|nr:RluA family pseudouridine synthase [Candidatus Hepatobacter penaei]